VVVEAVVAEAVIDLTEGGAGTGVAGEDDETVAPPGSPLGAPRAEADAAMREFFDGEGPAERRGLRRRR
jgi:hypothetical protein